MNQLKASGIAKFPLIIKGDVQGSVEAINASLNKLSTEEVSAQILMSASARITESDVTLAIGERAPSSSASTSAPTSRRPSWRTRDGIEIRYYNIIYDLVDDVKAAMSGLLKPERRETFIGYAEILEVFNITKVGKVAGCRVTEGIVERGAGVRLLRDNVVIHEGKLKTLKRFKDEVKEVPVGQECGMAFENYEDIRAGDVIECFRVETVRARCRRHGLRDVKGRGTKVRRPSSIPLRRHDHLRSRRHAVVEIDNVLVDQADAAGRDVGADQPGLDRAVQAEVGVGAAAVEIERAGAERVGRPALHAAGELFVALGLLA